MKYYIDKNVFYALTIGKTNIKKIYFIHLHSNYFYNYKKVYSRLSTTSIIFKSSTICTEHGSLGPVCYIVLTPEHTGSHLLHQSSRRVLVMSYCSILDNIGFSINVNVSGRYALQSNSETVCFHAKLQYHFSL